MHTSTMVSSLLLFLPAIALSQTLSGDLKASWSSMSGNLVKSAEKMAEADYSFRPVSTVRSFGELIGHITDAHYLFCSAVSTEKKAPQGAEKKLSTKTELVAALKESVAYCDAAVGQFADAQAAETVKFFGRDRAKLSVLHTMISHANEHYGNLVTYMRIKGVVPPSSEPRPSAAASARIYYDMAHGQTEPPPPMAEVGKRLSFETANGTQEITPETLKGSRVLYLRAPSKTFTAPEKEAIVSFVKGGGSLLLVLDEESRQKLADTGVNDIIAPFGLKLTPDTPYLHNCGAIAKAGEINKADREIPYSGGRAVEGGTPFAYQLDKDGKPGRPFATWKKVDNGGRIVVMGEGMASLFMGTKEGARLSGVPRDARNTVYWGGDSPVFMEEVLAWLIKK